MLGSVFFHQVLPLSSAVCSWVLDDWIWLFIGCGCDLSVGGGMRVYTPAVTAYRVTAGVYKARIGEETSSISKSKLVFYLLWHKWSLAPLPFRQVSSRPGLGRANHNLSSNDGRVWCNACPSSGSVLNNQDCCRWCEIVCWIRYCDSIKLTGCYTSQRRTNNCP